MRIVDSGAFCLRALVLAILCTLALAGSAYADESGTGTTQSETTETQGTGETSTGGGTTGESQSGGTTGSGEGASGGGATTETPVEPPPAKEEATGSTGSAGGEPAETPVATEPAPTEQAAAVLAPSASEEIVPTSSATSSHTPLAPDAATVQTVVAHSDSTGETSLQSQAMLGALTPTATAPTARATEEQAPATPATGGGGGPTLTIAQRAGALGCELSALGGRTTDNCTVGWLGAKRVLNPSTVSFVRVVGSGLVAVNGGGLPPGGGHGGATGSSAPVSPAPGPAPSGASGAAVGGSSGVAPSAFLSLAGLLLLAAPRAMRRLRLSCRPLLTACFVLIPERPG